MPAAAFREWAGSEGFTAPLARRLRALRHRRRRARWSRARSPIRAGAAIAGARSRRARRRGAGRGGRGRARARRRAGWSRRWRRRAGGGGPARRAVGPRDRDGGAGRGRRQRAGHRCAARCCCACRARRRWTTRSAPRCRVELRAAVDEPRVRVGAALLAPAARGAACAGARWRPGVALAALGTVVEAVLFRALFDARPARRRCSRVVVALLAALLVARSCRSRWGLRRAGRGASRSGFRDLFMRKIPRLGDRYFQSRPVSDMAERAHLVHKLRALPTLAGDIAAHGAGDRRHRGGAGLARSARRGAGDRARGGDAADPARRRSRPSPSAICACATTPARSGASISTRCSAW